MVCENVISNIEKYGSADIALLPLKCLLLLWNEIPLKFLSLLCLWGHSKDFSENIYLPIQFSGEITTTLQLNVSPIFLTSVGYGVKETRTHLWIEPIFLFHDPGPTCRMDGVFLNGAFNRFVLFLAYPPRLQLLHHRAHLQNEKVMCVYRGVV